MMSMTIITVLFNGLLFGFEFIRVHFIIGHQNYIHIQTYIQSFIYTFTLVFMSVFTNGQTFILTYIHTHYFRGAHQHFYITANIDRHHLLCWSSETVIFQFFCFVFFFRSFVHSFILQVLFVQQKRFGHHFCPALAAAIYSNSRIKCGEFKPLFIVAFMSSIKTEVDSTNIDGYCCHCYSCSFGCSFGLFLFFLPVFYAYSVAV